MEAISIMRGDDIKFEDFCINIWCLSCYYVWRDIDLVDDILYDIQLGDLDYSAQKSI